MLLANQLIGFGSATAAAAADVTIGFREAVADTATKTTYTFSAADIGADSASHKVVVMASWTGGATYSSSTIDGETGNAIVSASATGGNERIQMFYADAISATSGDVVIIVSGGSDRLGIAIFDVRNAASGAAFATSSDSDSSDPLTGSLNVEAGGGCLGGAFSDLTTTFIWTNLDEDYDVAIEGGDFKHSGASANFALAQTPLSVTADPSVDGRQGLVCASFSKE
jgi:hypothetical protein